MLFTIVGAICAGLGYLALMVFYRCFWMFLVLCVHAMVTVFVVARVQAFTLSMPYLEDYIPPPFDPYDPGHWVVALLLFLGGVLTPISAIVYSLDCFFEWLHVHSRPRIL